jgi:negative regulator of sigma E activity
MTDDERDELLSAVLDGVATDEEIGRVRTDPELSAALEELRRVQQLLGSPPPAPTGVARDQMIEAALTAFDMSFGSSTSTESTPSPVVDLAARRARRQRFVGVVGAAAVLLVAVVLGLGSIDGSSDSDSSDSATASADGADSDQEAGDTTDEAEGALDMAAAAPESALRHSADAEESAGGLSEDDAAATAPTTEQASLPAELPPDVEPCRSAVFDTVPQATSFEVTAAENDRITMVAVAPDGMRTPLQVDLTSCSVVVVPEPGDASPDAVEPDASTP